MAKDVEHFLEVFTSLYVSSFEDFELIYIDFLFKFGLPVST